MLANIAITITTCISQYRVSLCHREWLDLKLHRLIRPFCYEICVISSALMEAHDAALKQSQTRRPVRHAHTLTVVVGPNVKTIIMSCTYYTYKHAYTHTQVKKQTQITAIIHPTFSSCYTKKSTPRKAVAMETMGIN